MILYADLEKSFFSVVRFWYVKTMYIIYIYGLENIPTIILSYTIKKYLLE